MNRVDAEGFLIGVDRHPVRGANNYPYLIGRSHNLPVTKILWHTTEGSSISGAMSAYRSRAGTTNGVHPHMTVDILRNSISQHISLRRASYSMYDNNDQQGVIQIEVVGFARETKNWPDSHYEWLGRNVVAPILEMYPNINVDNWQRFYGAGEGVVLATARSIVRLSRKKFDAFNGQLGHQHAPAPDNHWDPGKWRPQVIAAAAHSEIANPTPISFATTSSSPTQGVNSMPIIKTGSKGTAVSDLQKILNIFVKANLVVDGDFGPATKAAVITYQSRLGVTPDGIWGPVSQAAHDAFMTYLKSTEPAPKAPKPAPKPAPKAPKPAPKPAPKAPKAPKPAPKPPRGLFSWIVSFIKRLFGFGK